MNAETTIENPADRADARAWELRHATKTLHLAPAPAQVFDYAGAAQRIQRGLFHLDEALPAGQEERVRVAFMLLRAGTEELAVWLRSRGLDV